MKNTITRSLDNPDRFVDTPASARLRAARDLEDRARRAAREAALMLKTEKREDAAAKKEERRAARQHQAEVRASEGRRRSLFASKYGPPRPLGAPLLHGMEDNKDRHRSGDAEAWAAGEIDGKLAVPPNNAMLRLW
mmetsp:Transcript_23099/g.52097  ORF Transcript_23099/g.52097 Transcript_23099/m.52097 type:complete len:136 (-) Transcript_23099:96-503(-)